MKNKNIDKERNKVFEQFPPTRDRLKEDLEYEAHNLLVNLYQARKERDEAKRNFKLSPYCKRKEQGERIYPCSNVADQKAESSLDFDKWCIACQNRQPLWQKYQDAANKAGAALRACLRYGKGQVK